VGGNGGGFTLDLKGEFAVGKQFTVTADVNEPLPDQTLALELPAGLELVAGPTEQKVPPNPTASKVNWQVKIQQPGKYSVKVKSSTGLVMGKSFTAGTADDAGQFDLALKGEFTPGKVFTVSALVTKPAPNQTLRLELPKGLERQTAAETLDVPPAPPGGSSSVQWQVKILDAGKYTVAVNSSTGLIRKKTITIGAVSDQGGFDIILGTGIKPGATFSVTAKVSNPAPDQKLTLVLPKQMELAGGTATQPVPAGQKSVEVTWMVRVVEAGRLPIRIESSTGLVRTKTITLKQSDGGTIFGK
jgi:hypothetical protein